MAKNYVQEGQILTWKNETGTAVASGSVVKVGHLLGVALVDLAPGDSGSVQVEGVFLCPKVANTAIPQGVKLLWDSSAGAFDLGTATPASGDVSLAAVAAAPALAGDATVAVRFAGLIGTVA